MMLLGLASYYLTFCAFSESWVPYYYEDYLSAIFMIGLLLLIVLPVAIAQFKRSSSERIGIYKSIIAVNIFAVVSCIAISFCMLSNGIFIGGSGPKFYQIVPDSK